jgi:hypothetical protein
MVEVSYEDVYATANSCSGFTALLRGHSRKVMAMFGLRRPKKLVIPRRR